MFESLRRLYRHLVKFLPKVLLIITFIFFIVIYTGTDADAPDTSNRAWWWNVFIFGPPNRQTQIAFSPFKNADTIYFRQLHDERKYGWYKISGTQV